MSTRRLADRDIVLEDECDLPDENQTQRLVLVLRELHDRLSRQIHGNASVVSKDVEKWAGGGYFYVEAALAGSMLPEIDVSIQGGRAFIRMAQ